MTVPYTFATSSGSIPLSYLDSNFATTITMGNTAVQLGDTITTFNNVTLANPTISNANMSGATITSGNVTATTITAITGTFSGNVQMASANGGQLAGLRNRIINGGMQVAQRGTATLTAAYQFGSCDRWQFICSGGTSISGTIFQNTFNAYSTNYSGGVQSASWTNGQFYAQQRIEAKNCFDLNNKTITVSARVYQDTGGTRSFDFVLVKATAVDNWTSQTTIAILSAGSAATAAPTLLSASYTLGATDASNGIALLIRDNATNTVVSKSYQIGDVQLEVGSVATPFEQRPYGMELALCQRYFQSLLIGGYGTNNAATVISRVTWPLFVAMRANPTIAVLSGTPSFFQGLNTANHSSIGATYITSTTAQADINVTGGSATAGLASIQKADGGIYSASAEL